MSNAVTTTSEGNVRITAGHTISNWAHLVWERYNQNAGQGAIRYALIQDGASCANAGQKTPTKITPSSNLSLSGQPVPPSADVDSPKIAVATNAVIARPSGGSGAMMMSAQSAQFDPTALLAQMSSEDSSADDSGAAATPAFDEGPASAMASLNALHTTEAQNETPPQPAPDCAATPDHPRCVEQAGLSQMGGMMGMAAQSASAAAASSFQCGSNAADAVVVSFYDDDNNQMYAALFQAGEVLNGSSCVPVVSAQYPNDGGLKLQKLTRIDYSSPCCTDYDDHYPFISKRGLPTVAWRGREPSFSSFNTANDEIYVAEGKFSAYAPIVRRP